MESHAQLITDDEGREYLKVHDTAEVLETVDETDEYVDYKVALATEIVQPYRIDGERQSVYKPADELEKATQTAFGAYITDGHPSEGVVKTPDHINGHIREPEFNADESTILGRARVYKKDENQNFREEIDSGKRADVSIGFYTRLVDESGEFNDTEYSKKQTNLVIDHLAILKPENDGRCSPEDGCGVLNNMGQDVHDHDGEITDFDVAYFDEGKADDVRAALEAEGFDASFRECNCGDHAGHITVGRDDFVPTHRALGDYGTQESDSWDGLTLDEIVDGLGFESEDEEEISSVDDLSDGQRRKVQALFAGIRGDQLDELSDGILEHHAADGDVDRAGIMAARQRIRQVKGVSKSLMRSMDQHLTAHLVSDFDEEDTETIFDWSSAEDGEKPPVRDRYKRETEESDDRGSKFMGNNDKELSDYSVDELADEHDGVADLVDQKESLEDELESIREDQRDELREEIKDEFDVSDERVADKDVDELEDLKETLDEVTQSDEDDGDGDQDGDSEGDSDGSTTSTNPPNNTDSSQGSGLVGTQGDGPYGDEYE